jgi:hypothetical protein
MPLRVPPTRSTLATESGWATNGEPVKLDKQELVRVLRTQGDNDTADKVEAGLPDEIDTDRDAGALEGAGLDRTQLMAKLAGGAFGGTLAP